MSLNLQVTVEHATLKACNAISENAKGQLLEALDNKFEMLRKEIQRDTGLNEYLKIDRTFRRVCEKSNVEDFEQELDTLKEAYKESIENATPSIIILYDDEVFKQQITTNIDIISKNPVGAQLLIDILVGNYMESDPVILISREMARHITPTIIKHGEKQLTKVTRIECDDPLSFFCYGNKECGHIICISTNNFSYNTISQQVNEYYLISKCQAYSDKNKEMDTTIFHELNHYRHYLQLGEELYSISHQKSTDMLVGIYDNDALLRVPFNAMYSKEEELQLIAKMTAQ